MATSGERCLSPIPRPKLKHLGHAQNKRNLIGALIASCLSGLAFKILYCERRKQAVEDYYATYDPDAHFRRLLEAHQISAAIALGIDQLSDDNKPNKPDPACKPKKVVN